MLWYITYLSKVIGSDLETIANKNIEKLKKDIQKDGIQIEVYIEKNN